jgi:hypothetical protein
MRNIKGALMFICVIGSRDGAQLVTATGDPALLRGQLQSHRPEPVSVHHRVVVDGKHTETVLTYIHALLSDYRIEGAWFAVTPAEATTAVKRGVAACKVDAKQSRADAPEYVSRVGAEIPTSIADRFRDLAWQEDRQVKSLLIEAIDLLFQARGLPPISPEI